MSGGAGAACAARSGGILAMPLVCASECSALRTLALVTCARYMRDATEQREVAQDATACAMFAVMAHFGVFGIARSMRST